MKKARSDAGLFSCDLLSNADQLWERGLPAMAACQLLIY